jgi:hypothetical protein
MDHSIRAEPEDLRTAQLLFYPYLYFLFLYFLFLYFLFLYFLFRFLYPSHSHS